MPTVARLNVTPVKSTGLDHPDRIVIEPRGALGNREFVFIQDDGERLSGISKAPLMGIHSSYDPDSDHLALLLPDGRIIEGSAQPTGPILDVTFYGGVVHPVRVLAPELAGAASGLVSRPLRLARLVDPATHTIGDPVSLLSGDSVRTVADRAGLDGIDARRFRMLIEIEGTQPFEEESWSGMTLGVGDAELLVTRPVSRCVMTTMHPDTGAQDVPVLDLLAQHKGRGADGKLNIGVYADVVRPGTVRVGDRVTVRP
ncbi:MAG: MOSC domain-containing protein [Actinomycetota bacterium]